MIKWLVMRYIKHACENRSDAAHSQFDEIIKTIFTHTAKVESESNDSTVYAYLMADIKMAALKELHYVSDGLKEIKF